MKLLMTADAVGGVWQYATDLATALIPHNVETVIAVLGPAPDEDQRAAISPGVTLIDTGLPLDWLVDGAAPVREAALRLATLAREVEADVIHLNSASLAGAARFPCPVVAVAHGCIGTWWEAAEATPLPKTFAWQVEMMREGLAAADAVVTPTHGFATALRCRYGLAAIPTVVHNGRARSATVGDSPPSTMSSPPAGCGTGSRTHLCSTPSPPICRYRCAPPDRLSRPMARRRWPLT